MTTFENGDRVSVRHEDGRVETGTVYGRTHTADFPQVFLRMDDDTTYAADARRVSLLVEEAGPSNEIDLDAVVGMLRGRGIAAFCEMTGGGVATIFAGASDADGRYEVVAGPGWFDGEGWTDARGDTADFCFGPDDDGETDPTYTEAGWDERKIADAIAALIRPTVTDEMLAVADRVNGLTVEEAISLGALLANALETLGIDPSRPVRTVAREIAEEAGR